MSVNSAVGRKPRSEGFRTMEIGSWRPTRSAEADNERMETHRDVLIRVAPPVYLY